MSHARILIAGVGNIFLGDDAFGVEVAQRMLRRTPRDGVRVVDFGIRGLDLAYALLDDYEAVILVDAAPRGEAPGTLYVIEPDTVVTPESGPTDLTIDTHGMDPVKVLRLVAALGGRVRRLLVVGCEPTPSGDAEEIETGMSAPVRAAAEEAVTLIESLLADILRDEPVAPASERKEVGR